MWLSSLFNVRNLLRSVAGVLGMVAVFFLLEFPLSKLTAILIVVALVALGAVWLASETGNRRARTQGLAFAATNPWTYVEERNGMFWAVKTPPFDAAERSYTQVVTGQFGGYECFDGVFEWRKRLDSDHSISGRHRVAAVRLPDELPRLMLLPEGLGARLAKAFGGADMDFESSTFNRSWRVLADDPRVASQMLSPRVLGTLEEMQLKAPMLFERGWGIRIDDESKGVDSLAARLGGIVAVARFLPQHTIDDHGRLANSPGPLPSVATPGALTHGYDPELAAADAEFLRTAKARKRQKWLDAASGGEVPRVGDER